MLWKIIKNNYGKYVFAIFAIAVVVQSSNNIKHCPVLLPSNIYDINYPDIFSPIIKKILLADASHSPSPLIRCNGK